MDFIAILHLYQVLAKIIQDIFTVSHKSMPHASIAIPITPLEHKGERGQRLSFHINKSPDCRSETTIGRALESRWQTLAYI
jgi:hypothetical protein